MALAPRIAPRRPATRAERMARVQWALGAALTVIATWLVFIGATRPLEYPAEDLRHKAFARSNPSPSPDIAVFLIDDAALEIFGRWPWDRSLLAAAIDQLTDAGAHVIALDLLLDEPQEPGVRLGDDQRITVVDHDAALARAIARHGRCVLATSFVHAAGVAGQRTYTRADGERRATFEGALEELRRDPAATDEQLWERLFETPAAVGPALRDLSLKAQAARTLIAKAEVNSVAVPDAPARWAACNAPETPIAALAEPADRIGSVSFAGGDPDDAVRRIPLWTQVGDRLFPALGLAASALWLDAPLAEAEVSAKATTLRPSAGGALRIPMHRAPLTGFPEGNGVDGLLYITWPEGGFGGWTAQFPAAARRPALIPLGRLLEPRLRMLPEVRRNIADLDASLALLNSDFELVNRAEHAARSARLAELSPEDFEFGPLLEQHIASWRGAVDLASQMLGQFQEQGIDQAELTEEERGALDLLSQVVERAPRQIEEVRNGIDRYLEAQRREIPAFARGRICFIGWSATGALADFVPTSIAGKTPGVLIHAAVANSILTSRDEPQFLTPAPIWTSVCATLVMGAIGAFIGVRSGVILGPFTLLVFMVSWIAFDGIVLWDRGNLVVAITSPLATGFLAWLLVILHRLLVEQRGRKRTEERFRAYVPPDVVDILVNNPTLSSMAPQKRELTMLFSDIEGFTTLSERLGTEGISRLLSSYLGAMTQILLSRKATLDKYLGDGIMAFWGAPLDDPEHGRNAVSAAVQMLEQLNWMNDAGMFDDATPGTRLAIRIGLAAGEVNVGDFGNPPRKSAYTVIGDSVNLAARLESANKQFGTGILINQRLRELIGDEFPLRLIGRVVVKGKRQFETLYEVVAPGHDRGPRTAEWIRCTNSAVEAFINRDFDACLAELVRLESEFDDGALADVYRHAVATARMAPETDDDFTGAIVLTEK